MSGAPKVGPPGPARTSERVRPRWLPRLSLGAVCFLVSLAVYLATRIVGLTAFPVAFLGDEAVQVVDAARLVEHGVRDEYGDLLPTYHRNGPYLNLGVSVYLQIVPHLVFGYSEAAARAVTVVVTLSGAMALALVLGHVFRIRLWWAGVLLLSIVPAWFLHSRTALESPLGCSFYAWFLAFYLLFRTSGKQLMLYAAIVAGALAFYTYAPLKVVVVVTSVLLVLSDARWLAAQRPVLWRAALLVVAMALPELRFQIAHEAANADQLRVLGSYVVDPHFGTAQKLRRYMDEYAAGLDPRYWYDPGDTRDLRRHVMRGYGNVLAVTAPFALVGLATAVARVRDTRYRALLIAAVAAPSGPALVQVALPRALVVVVPLTVLTALGLDVVAGAAARFVRSEVVVVATLVILSGASVAMAADALRHGPTWYDDYGLYGQQFGGREIGRAVREELRRRPDQHVVVTSAWANASDIVIAFFVSADRRVRVENPAAIVSPRKPRAGLEQTLFVVTADELEQIRKAGVYREPSVIARVRLPDGRPGFFFVRLRHSKRAKSILAERRRTLRTPVTERATVDGTLASITHPPFDTGAVASLLDEDTFTLARTADAEVMELRIVFDEPRRLERVKVVGAEQLLEVEVEVEPAGRAGHTGPLRAVARPGQESVVVTVAPRPLDVRAVVVRASDATAGADPHVHVRELVLE